MRFDAIPLVPSEIPEALPRSSDRVVSLEWNQDQFERAWEHLEDSVKAVTQDKEAFMQLEQGLPLDFVKAVDSFAYLCGPYANAFIEQTHGLRTRLTELNYRLESQGPLFSSEARQQEHQATVEHMLDMLRDPGYARLILREIAIRHVAQTGDMTLAREHGIAPDVFDEAPFSEEERSRQTRFAYSTAMKRGWMPRHRLGDYSSEEPVEVLFPDVDRTIQQPPPVTRVGRAGGYTRSVQRASTLAELQKPIARTHIELTPPSNTRTE